MKNIQYALQTSLLPTQKNWYIPSNFVSDYFNSCSNPSIWGVPYNSSDNYQFPKTGSAYIGILILNAPPNNFRGYYQTKLNDSLKKNKSYYCEFFVSNSERDRLKCNNVSMLLTKQAIYVDTNITPNGVLHANPQITNYGNPIINDTLNWVKVSGVFKAQGGEQYLTLGNFKDDAHTSYIISQPTGYGAAGIMIDDVSVIPLDSFCLKADAGQDTTINAGDSVFIGSYTNGIDSIRWLNGATVIDSVQPGFWVAPTATTSYTVCQIVNGCASCDTVTVVVKPLPLKMMSYELQIMNEKQVLNKWQTSNEVNVSHYNIERSINAKDFEKVGSVKANNKSYNEYNFEDDLKTNTQSPKTLYYRIVGIDNDGKRTYSIVKSLELKVKSNGISIYPNPSRDYVNISGNNIEQITITTIEGKEILQTTSKKINISNLASGIYLINIKTQNNITTQKLIKQ